MKAYFNAWGIARPDFFRLSFWGQLARKFYQCFRLKMHFFQDIQPFKNHQVRDVFTLQLRNVSRDFPRCIAPTWRYWRPILRCGPGSAWTSRYWSFWRYDSSNAVFSQMPPSKKKAVPYLNKVRLLKQNNECHRYSRKILLRIMLIIRPFVSINIFIHMLMLDHSLSHYALSWTYKHLLYRKLTL